MTRHTLDLPMERYEVLERIAILVVCAGYTEADARAKVHEWQEQERRRGEQGELAL